jgi:hypothetical protein
VALEDGTLPALFRASGPFDTDDVDPDRAASVRDMIEGACPMRRLATPKEVASADSVDRRSCGRRFAKSPTGISSRFEVAEEALRRREEARGMLGPYVL